MNIQEDYWNRRARYSCFYKNEAFYTITPVPLYYYRRKYLLDRLIPFVAAPQTDKICDFGCGDGWYIQFFDKRFPGKQWTGMDISQEMLNQAIGKSPKANFVLLSPEEEASQLSQVVDDLFDLVYAIAVFAHILDDSKVEELFFTITNKLRPGGKFVMFEQTAPQHVVGNSFCRRLSANYKSIAERCGLIVESSQLIKFPAHIFFERKIAPYFYKYYANVEKDDFLARMRANHNLYFRLLSRIAIVCSPKYVWPDEGQYWGNSFIVFRKP